MEIPAEFVATTVESRGEAGRARLAGLPGLVQELLEDWSLRPDGPVMHGFADTLWCRGHQASAVPCVETMVAALL